MSLGIAMALACAAVTQLGFLCKHRGATSAPLVDARRPLRSARSLFASKWFALGMLVATGAWGFHVAAMAMAPLSIVQTVISGGLVFLTVSRRPHPWVLWSASSSITKAGHTCPSWLIGHRRPMV